MKIWDYVAQTWVSAEGKEVHAGNIENVPTKEKAKFPQHFFPEVRIKKSLKKLVDPNFTLIIFL